VKLKMLVPITLAAVLACSAAAPSALAQAGPDSDGDGLVDNEDLCPKLAGPGNTGGCPSQDGSPDSDGDGLQDSQDFCPTVPGDRSGQGCPDSDSDYVDDASDPCPTSPGPPGSNGCGDVDRDGVSDETDLCLKEGQDPRYPNRNVKPNGCYPTFVEVAYFAGSVTSTADDRGGIMHADCDFNHGEKCVVRVTMTLSEKSAKALGLKNARIVALTIPLTTEADKEAAHPRPPACRCRDTPRGTLRLGLSAGLKKKIGRLPSLTMTMRVTYTVGSDAPETMKKVFKLTRKNTGVKNAYLRNIPDFNEERE
jgi:hypothetical protein